jgi:hypothetical protein
MISTTYIRPIWTTTIVARLFLVHNHYAISRNVAGSIPDVIGFLIDLIFQPHYGPGIDSASNRNEYQESSWGWRAAGA